MDKLIQPHNARPAAVWGSGGGTYDRIVRLADLVALRDAWPGSELIEVPQAHFGYGMIPRAFARLSERDLLGKSRS